MNDGYIRDMPAPMAIPGWIGLRFFFTDIIKGYNHPHQLPGSVHLIVYGFRRFVLSHIFTCMYLCIVLHSNVKTIKKIN
jgi:hypothetical protein